MRVLLFRLAVVLFCLLCLARTISAATASAMESRIERMENEQARHEQASQNRFRAIDQSLTDIRVQVVPIVGIQTATKQIQWDIRFFLWSMLASAITIIGWMGKTLIAAWIKKHIVHANNAR